MTITIKIDTYNAAFTNNEENEIERILTIWVQRGCRPGPLPPDYNGNHVGTVTVRGK